MKEMTPDERWEMLLRVQKNAGMCCIHIAMEALERCNWDEDLAMKYAAEKDRLKDDFNLTEFRRKYVKD